MSRAENPRAGGRPARGARWLAGWVTCSIALTLCSFVAGTFVRSPWEAAAQNSTQVSTASAEVEQRDFPIDVPEAAGTVRLGSVIDVLAPEPSIGRPVVTASPVNVGEEVHPGSRVAEISGRPVIALALPFRLYRDLTPGTSGPDVAAVQEALAGLGLYGGATDGQFGPQTSAAVRALYADAGAGAPQPDAELALAVVEADRALTEAEGARLDAVRERDRAGQADGAGEDGAAQVLAADSGLRLADAAVRAAQLALTAARAAAETPLPATEVVRVPGGTAVVVLAAPPDTEVSDSSPAVRLRVGAPGAVIRVGVQADAAFPVGATVLVRASDDPTLTALAVVETRGEFDASQDDTRVPGVDATLTFLDAPGLRIPDGASVTAVPDGIAEVEPGLAVPLVAVRDGPDGQYVLRITSVGEPGEPPVTEQVPLVVVRTADGFAAVEPQDDSPLGTGDQVLIGRLR